MKKAQKQAIAIGGGVAALAAAATAVYFMTGKHAKNRKKVAKWAKDMQHDVIKELNKAGKVSQTTYNKAVDSVAKNYKGMKNVSLSELAMTAAELKGHWDSIRDEMGAASQTVKRIAPKSVKSIAKKVAVKKTVKKVAKKVAKKVRK